MPPRWNYSTRKQKLERKRTRDQAIRKQISQRTSDKTRNKPQQKEKTQIKEKVKAILEKRIVNLSLRTLTESETNLLRKGLNFCPTPPPPSREQLNKDNDAFGRRLSLKEYHAPDEIDDLSYERPAYKSSTLEKLNKREQQINFKPSREPYINTYIETLKQDVNEILSTRQKDQRSNLTKRERAALYRLSKDKEIVIKPADKGGATVIMNSADYIEEAMRQLNNQEYYKLVDRDLTVEHEQHIIESISEHVKNKEIDEDIGALLKPANSRTPLFYMLPKIHKANNPGRPVISSVNSHTENNFSLRGRIRQTFGRKNSLPRTRHNRLHFTPEKVGKITKGLLLSHSGRKQLVHQHRHRRRTQDCGGRIEQSRTDIPIRQNTD